MKSVSTESLFDPAENGECGNLACLPPLVVSDELTTDALDFDPSESRGGGVFQSLMSAIVISWGSALAKGSSQQLHPLWQSVVPAIIRQEDFEDQFASFFEPVEFNWNNSQFVAREAAREFCEGSHADN